MTPSLPRQRAQDPQQEQERPGQQQEAEEEQQAEKVEEQGTGGPAREQPTDELVRSRLLTISQAPGHAEDGKRPQSSGDETDMYRRNLMSVSYLEVPEGA